VRVCGWGRGENECEIKDPSVDNEAKEQLDREPVAEENPASSRGGVFASRAEGVAVGDQTRPWNNDDARSSPE